MGKLARLTAVNSAKTGSFVYIPPKSAFGAVRIIVKANIGYIKGPPITVSMQVLGAVLKGLRRANPGARILIIEGVSTRFPAEDTLKATGLLEHMDDNMILADLETMPMKAYKNPLANPFKFESLYAPELFEEYDCRISVSSFKRTIQANGKPLVRASMENLYGLFPRDRYALPDNPHERGQLTGTDAEGIIRDMYFSVGRLFDGAVVDLGQMLVSEDDRLDTGNARSVGKVVWGDDMLAVDEVACRVAGEPLPEYIKTLNTLRKQVDETGA